MFSIVQGQVSTKQIEIKKNLLLLLEENQQWLLLVINTKMTDFVYYDLVYLQSDKTNESLYSLLQIHYQTFPRFHDKTYLPPTPQPLHNILLDE